MTPEQALALVRGQRLGVLVTLKSSGRPQTSNVVYAVVDRHVLVSVTQDRAKTRNLQRDPRATLHVSTPDGSSWAAVEGDTTLSPVTTESGDDAGMSLRRLFVSISGEEHPDWAQFDQAMIDERRLLLRIEVSHGYGGGAG